MLWERSSRILMDDRGAGAGAGDDFTFAAAQPPPRLLSTGGGGCMGPPLLYPVFGRPRSPPQAAPDALQPETATALVPLGRLLLMDKDPPPAPENDVDKDHDHDSVPAETFFPWSPGWSTAAAAAAVSSPAARCKKSGSTGSVLRWRPRLVVGRSQSDGKEKFVFLSAAAASSGGSSSSAPRNHNKGRGAAVESAAAAAAGGGVHAHAWSCYVNGNKGGGGGVRRRRSTFLPYKQDLVGLFANAAVFRRSYLPF